MDVGIRGPKGYPPTISSTSCRFVLRDAVPQTKYCCPLKFKIFATEILGWLRCCGWCVELQNTRNVAVCTSQKNVFARKVMLRWGSFFLDVSVEVCGLWGLWNLDSWHAFLFANDANVNFASHGHSSRKQLAFFGDVLVHNCWKPACQKNRQWNAVFKKQVQKFFWIKFS